MNWASVSPANSCVEAWTPNVMVFGGPREVIMRVGPPWWDRCPYKKRKRKLSSGSAVRGHSWEAGVCKGPERALTRGHIWWHYNVGITGSGSVINTFLLFKSPSLEHSITAPRADQDVSRRWSLRIICDILTTGKFHTPSHKKHMNKLQHAHLYTECWAHLYS